MNVTDSGSREWRPDEALLRALGVAALATTPDGRLLHVTEAALELLGTDAVAQLSGGSLVSKLFPAPERAAAARAWAMVRDGRRWDGSLPVGSAGGSQSSPMMVSWVPVRVGDTVQGSVLLMAEGVSAGVRPAEARWQFLADASAELAASLDYEATLGAVARLAVPQFADWCAVHLFRDGQARLIAAVHRDPAKEHVIRELHERYPPDRARTWGVHHVARTGPALIAEVPDPASFAVDEEHLRVLRALQPYSYVQVPLRVGDRVLGVITWAAVPGRRRYGPEDLMFLENLADRASLAIDNAQLHSEVLEVSRRLQEAVLPAALPKVAGWDIVGEYRPAGRTQAGGDFYDVVTVSDGRIAAFVGDVMGRGVQAAATMSQMRAAVWTLIAQDPSPAAVMTGLDRLFAREETEQLVSCLYVLSDSAGHVEVANAGHPPPVVARHGSPPTVVATSRNLVLGAGGGERDTTSVSIGPGDTLLMFTDGLIERRDEDIDQGHARASNSAALLTGDCDLEWALQRLIEEVSDPDSDDDAAALALRRVLER